MIAKLAVWPFFVDFSSCHQPSSHQEQVKAGVVHLCCACAGRTLPECTPRQMRTVEYINLLALEGLILIMV